MAAYPELSRAPPSSRPRLLSTPPLTSTHTHILSCLVCVSCLTAGMPGNAAGQVYHGREWPGVRGGPTCRLQVKHTQSHIVPHPLPTRPAAQPPSRPAALPPPPTRALSHARSVCSRLRASERQLWQSIDLVEPRTTAARAFIHNNQLFMTRAAATDAVFALDAREPVRFLAVPPMPFRGNGRSRLPALRDALPLAQIFIYTLARPDLNELDKKRPQTSRRVAAPPPPSLTHPVLTHPAIRLRRRRYGSCVP